MQHLIRALAPAILVFVLGCDNASTTGVEVWRSDPALPADADFAAEFDHIAIDVRPEGCAVEAFDHRGEMIGRIAFVNIDDDIKRVSSEYADGTLVVEVDITTDEVHVVEQTIESHEATRRARLIKDMIGSRSDPQAFNPFEGWTGCAVGVASTVAACVPTPATVWALLRCPIAAAGASCACVKAANNGKAKRPCGKEKK